MRVSRKLWATGLILAFVVGVGIWLAHELRIDSCLDRGGRWDFGRGMCEGARE
jgi:hypothetical protein